MRFWSFSIQCQKHLGLQNSFQIASRWYFVFRSTPVSFYSASPWSSLLLILLLPLLSLYPGFSFTGFVASLQEDVFTNDVLFMRSPPVKPCIEVSHHHMSDAWWALLYFIREILVKIDNLVRGPPFWGALTFATPSGPTRPRIGCWFPSCQPGCMPFRVIILRVRSFYISRALLPLPGLL